MQIFIIVIVSTIFTAAATLAQEFGYDGAIGPKFWGKKYQQCFGKHQSPINIEEHNVETLKLVTPIHYQNFDQPIMLAEIRNNGHTVALTTNGTRKPVITGGPLLGNYEFSQLHFHWGSDDNEGSETTINNSSFPMELHVVFYQQAYGSIKRAMEHPDGLAVLSFLFAKSNEENLHYKPLIDVLPNLVKSNTSVKLGAFSSLNDLTTPNRSVYFTYGGSLTTPPCLEVVTWIEFKQTIPLEHEQIELFRHIRNSKGNYVNHNFRPTQPLHGRLIRMVHEDEIINDMHKSGALVMRFSVLAFLVIIIDLLL